MDIADPENVLPDAIEEAEYWRALHARPLEDWLPALHRIREQHALPPGGWSRFRLGKNVVFGSPQLVLKLAPPFWAGDLRAEAETLRFVYGRLPLATPAVVAQGTLGAWGYLLQERLPGEPLRFHWPELNGDERAALAYRQGEIMAALHALPIEAAPPGLAFPWAEMLFEQRADCRRGLHASGVPPELLRDLDAYLESVWPQLIGNTEGPTALPGRPGRVLLHGDLDAINLLVVRQGGTLCFSGLVDWGDAKLGPSMHELISPGVHTMIGDRPALGAWYRGYGLPLERAASIERDVMARSMLYYADELNRYLERVPGASACRRWCEVAAQFWQLNG